jgi:hypothetical protein
MQYTLEDFLVKLHMGQWFGWSDPKNKTYANLVIHSDDTKPTEQECLDGVTALQSAYDQNQYQRDRAQEYPPMTDYLDGVVKNDQEQIDKYIADCLAVKARYPKP